MFFLLKELSYWMDPLPVSFTRKPFSLLTGLSQTSAPSWSAEVLHPASTAMSSKRNLKNQESNSMHLYRTRWQRNRIEMRCTMGCVRVQRTKHNAITFYRCAEHPAFKHRLNAFPASMSPSQARRDDWELKTIYCPRCHGSFPINLLINAGSPISPRRSSCQKC